MLQAQHIILASRSPSRAMMLRNAKIRFKVIPADINESRLISEHLKRGVAHIEVGKALSKHKAALVSEKKACRDKLVLGADQILSFENDIFEKPKNRDDAKKTLTRLRGKTHKLISCVSICFNQQVVFEVQDEALLKMHNFSDDFLSNYLKITGHRVLSSVGAYQLEREGAHLFEEIKGDFFTVLGLPLLPILNFLRSQGVLKK